MIRHTKHERSNKDSAYQGATAHGQHTDWCSGGCHQNYQPDWNGGASGGIAGWTVERSGPLPEEGNGSEGKRRKHPHYVGITAVMTTAHTSAMERQSLDKVERQRRSQSGNGRPSNAHVHEMRSLASHVGSSADDSSWGSSRARFPVVKSGIRSE